MSSRSSIFSFDTLKNPPKPDRVFFLVVLIIICFGTFLSMKRVLLEKYSQRAPLLTSVLSYLEQNNRGDEKVVFLGSSRFVSCIKTDQLSQLSGLDSSRFINLAVDSGGLWESLFIMRKNPSLLESSPLIVIEIEPWMFNANLIHPIYKKPHPFEPYFYTWSTFRERLEHPDTKSKLSLLADYFWPISERRNLEQWFSTVHAITTKKVSPGHLTIPHYHYNIDAYKSLANAPIFKAKVIAQYHLNNFSFAKHKAAYLKRLVDLAQNNATRIILLQPPVRQEYMEVIYKNPQYLLEYKKVLSFIKSLGNDTVHSIIWETPQDCGMDDSVFIDYGHFNIKGAYIFTNVLFRKLNEMGLIETNPSGKDIAVKKAIKKLEASLKTDRKNHTVLYTLGNLYTTEGNTIKAEEYYKAALSLQPHYPEAIQNLSRLYSETGKYHEALSLLKQMIDIQPDNPDVYYNIACIHAKLNNVRESIDWLKKAIDKGFSKWDLLQSDTDLDAIRNSEGYQDLLKGR